jgi:hypothetical protein
VRANLLPKPTVIREGSAWRECCLGDDPKLFFGVHRLEFSDTIDDVTDGKFVVLNLVEGERCEIVTGTGAATELRFAESIVIPAAAGRYALRNTGSAPCKAVKAFVKG